jgi:hypothetical protein
MAELATPLALHGFLILVLANDLPSANAFLKQYHFPVAHLLKAEDAGEWARTYLGVQAVADCAKNAWDEFPYFPILRVALMKTNRPTAIVFTDPNKPINSRNIAQADVVLDARDPGVCNVIKARGLVHS